MDFKNRCDSGVSLSGVDKKRQFEESGFRESQQHVIPRGVIGIQSGTGAKEGEEVSSSSLSNRGSPIFEGESDSGIELGTIISAFGDSSSS